MRVEEILPHLGPVMPTPNDIAEVLERLAQRHAVERDGSYFARVTPVPIDTLFASEPQREAARAIVEIVREIDEKTGEGARMPLIVRAAKERGFDNERVLDVMAILRNAGEVYSVGSDRVRIAKG